MVLGCYGKSVQAKRDSVVFFCEERRIGSCSLLDLQSVVMPIKVHRSLQVILHRPCHPVVVVIQVFMVILSAERMVLVMSQVAESVMRFVLVVQGLIDNQSMLSVVMLNWSDSLFEGHGCVRLR